MTTYAPTSYNRHGARLVSDDGTPGSDVLVRASETRHVANAMAVEQLAEQTFAVRGTHHDDAVVVRTEEGGEYRLDEGGWPSHWLAGFREVAVGNPGRWIGPFMVHRAPYPVVCTKWTVESLADSDRGRFHAILRPFVPPATQIDLALSPSDLRGCRHGLGLTQAQLAHALGVSRSAVARWEQGTRAAPRHLRLAMEALAARAHEEAPQGVTPDEVQPGIAP